jgi:N-acetylmuramoyl-L-alanine amidase CwlA
VKSLQLKQKPIDPVEQRELVKDPQSEHVCEDGKKEDAHKANGGKGHDKLKSRRPKLSFKELIHKYKKITEANVTSRSKKVQSSRLSPKRKSQESNW